MPRKQRKGPPERDVVSVTPPLPPKDKRALDTFIDKINRLPNLFTGNRFVFRDSVVVLTKMER